MCFKLQKSSSSWLSADNVARSSHHRHIYDSDSQDSNLKSCAIIMIAIMPWKKKSMKRQIAVDQMFYNPHIAWCNMNIHSLAFQNIQKYYLSFRVLSSSNLMFIGSALLALGYLLSIVSFALRVCGCITYMFESLTLPVCVKASESSFIIEWQLKIDIICSSMRPHQLISRWCIVRYQEEVSFWADWKDLGDSDYRLVTTISAVTWLSQNLQQIKK